MGGDANRGSKGDSSGGSKRESTKIWGYNVRTADPLEEVKKKRFEEGNLMILWNLKKSIYWLSSSDGELHKRNIKEHLPHYVENDGKVKTTE